MCLPFEDLRVLSFFFKLKFYISSLQDPARILNINSSSSSNSFSKTQKLTKEHKEKNSKDSKEQKSAFKEPSREHNKSSKESSKKPKENKPLRDEKMVPKMAFKEPKPMSKEPKSENTPILTITCGQQQEKKTLTKRPSMLDTDESSARKRKKSSSDSLFKSFPSAPPLILTCSADKKQTKDKSQLKVGRVKVETDALERKTPTLPPFDDIVDPSDSDMEENVSSKSDVSSCLVLLSTLLSAVLSICSLRDCSLNLCSPLSFCCLLADCPNWIMIMTMFKLMLVLVELYCLFKSIQLLIGNIMTVSVWEILINSIAILMFFRNSSFF